MSELMLQNVGYRYRNAEKDVLQNISVNFEAGKLYAIVGPSGSGKSTLLSLMAGLDRPGVGTILLDGKPYSSLDLDQVRRERLSMIFQAFQLFPLLTAIENVCFPMRANGIAQKQAQEQAESLLRSVGIGEEKFKRYPANLSGGEQQRVAIARALSTGAGVILADEPTGNLDGENGAQVMELLLGLAHQANRCVIVVTHDLEIAQQADSVWKMRDGMLKTA